MPDTTIRSRAWTAPADLASMTAAMSRAWAGPMRPLVPGTVGDLEWWTAGGGPDADWANRIWLWERDGRVVAWGWFTPPASLDWFVDETLDPGEVRSLREEVLDWHHLQTLRGVRTRLVEAEDDSARDRIAAEPLPVMEAWAGEGWSEEAILVEHGWTRSETALSQYLQPLDVDFDPPRIPDGYELRHVRGPDEIPARVDAHRAAFAPSKMTIEKYEICVAQPHYAWDHDLVIVAPDGAIAAFTMCWRDPAGSIGEFEPVGVHPDHQRRGLGKAIMRAGLRRFREDGLRDAIVFSLRSNAASEALYRASGFDAVAVHRQYTKPLES